MDTLIKRNFQSLAEGLRQQRVVNDKQGVRLTTLENTVVQLQQQLTEIQVINSRLLVGTVGTGPTVKQI